VTAAVSQNWRCRSNKWIEPTGGAAYAIVLEPCIPGGILFKCQSRAKDRCNSRNSSGCQGFCWCWASPGSRLAAVRAPRTRRPGQRRMRRAAKSCSEKLNRRRGRGLAPAKRTQGGSRNRAAGRTDFDRSRATAGRGSESGSYGHAGAGAMIQFRCLSSQQPLLRECGASHLGYHPSSEGG
jgi:hypothetical protein